MWRWIVRIGLVAAVMTGATGCVTAALLDTRPAPVVIEYSFANVEAAWRDGKGNLAVCVKGWATGRPLSGKPRLFTLAVPADFMDPRGPNWSKMRSSEGMLSWASEMRDLKPGCRQKPLAASPVKVIRYPAYMANSAGKTIRRPLYKLMASADLSRLDPVIYSFDDAEGDGVGIMVYQAGKLRPGGRRFVRLQLPYEQRNGHDTKMLLLPVAIAADIVLIVGSIYFSILAPGSF